MFYLRTHGKYIYEKTSTEKVVKKDKQNHRHEVGDK